VAPGKPLKEQWIGESGRWLVSNASALTGYCAACSLPVGWEEDLRADLRYELQMAAQRWAHHDVSWRQAEGSEWGTLTTRQL
jgi:hypothetical protein